MAEDELTEEEKVDLFLKDLEKVENREILKNLITWTGVEQFGRNFEFTREVLLKFLHIRNKDGKEWEELKRKYPEAKNFEVIKKS